MSPEPAPVPYVELMAQLGALCSAQRTGTMFIATMDNQSARIGLRQGEIVSLVFRTRRGLEAADHIRKIAAGRFTFSDAVVDRGSSPDLPETSILLGLLASPDPAVPAPPVASLHPPPRAAAPVRPQPAPGTQLARAQAVIEAELTEFVGPIAPLLCRDHMAKAVAAGPPWDVPALIEAISREIGDRAKEDRFKQQALARLR